MWFMCSTVFRALWIIKLLHTHAEKKKQNIQNIWTETQQRALSFAIALFSQTFRSKYLNNLWADKKGEHRRISSDVKWKVQTLSKVCDTEK
jgi:hypothetical protein